MSERTHLVFAALADPTRRGLMEILSSQGSQNTSELASQFPISRQGVTKHLGILEEAELVAVRRQGREAVYQLQPGALLDAVSWIEEVAAEWDKRLDALKDYLLDEGSDGG